MKVTSHKMSLEQARKLINAKKAIYPPTQHNRKQMAKATDESLQKLHKAQVSIKRLGGGKYAVYLGSDIAKQFDTKAEADKYARALKNQQNPRK